MKQRLSKLALLVVTAAFIVAGFPACDDGEDESSPVVLKSIQVETKPTKTTYSVGDTFNPTGLVIKEVYSNGTTIDVAYSDENKDAFKFAGFDASTANPNVTVTVTYKEKRAEFTVSVEKNEPDPDKTIASIAVATNPTKVAYKVGDTLDPAGLVITVTYDDPDSTTDSIAYNDANKDDFSFTGFDASEVKDSVTVTVTYREKTATFAVSVEKNEPNPDKTIASIAVTTKPTKTEYTLGDTTLDPAGLVITVTYTDDDSTTDTIAYNDTNKGDFSFTGFDASEVKDSVTVTVTYKEKTATFTVSVKEKGNEPAPEKTLASIAVKTNPTKAEYTVGETLDPAGLVITATYSDKSTEDIAYNATDFTLDFDSSAAGDSVTVTVTYKEKTATFTVSVKEAEKSLFETLSAQENNILTEDFATAFTPGTFGATFGKKGVYGDDGVTVADGAISTGSGKNRKIYVDFGPVKDVVEGCVTLTVGGTQPQASKNLLTFYNGDTAVLALKTGTGDNTVGGTAGTYEIYYKFDLTAKTVSFKVNGKDITGIQQTVDSVSGYTIESHNSGKGTVTADDIAVCATEGDLATYKAQVKALLATLVANSYTNGYTMNEAAVNAAKSAGDSAIDAADSIETVLAAYGNAKDELGKVKNDVAQTKENACTELEGYFPEGKDAENYTEDQLVAVVDAKAAGKTAINAATTVEAVNEALADAKKAIDALPDNSATAYTVTVKDSDGNDLGTVTAYTTVESVLDEIKKRAADQGKVIKDGKVYTDQACTAEYDTATELAGDVTVYVTLEEDSTYTWTFSGTNGSTAAGSNASLSAPNNKISIGSTKNILYKTVAVETNELGNITCALQANSNAAGYSITAGTSDVSLVIYLSCTDSGAASPKACNLTVEGAKETSGVSSITTSDKYVVINVTIEANTTCTITPSASRLNILAIAIN